MCLSVYTGIPLSYEAAKGMGQNDRRLWQRFYKVLDISRMAVKCTSRLGVALCVAAALAAEADGIGVIAPVSKVGHEVLL